MRFIQSAGITAGITALLSLGMPTAAEDTVVVYDASNSMWGQIEGEAKISIARRVMTDLIAGWNSNTNIGLVAYGHRHVSDCSDIETVVPVGPVDREALTKQIATIQPKGRTPLTAAVRHAADALNFRDSPATVVLVSDGIESCDADPCAVSKELARAGIRFTAHVVGFDVSAEADQAQLRCIAENTGGRFFAARDAEGLREALDEVAAMAAQPAPPEAVVLLTAPDSAVAGSEVAVSWEGENIQPQDMVVIVSVDAEPDMRDSHKRIREHSGTTLRTPEIAGPHELRYLSTASGRVVARKPIQLTEPQATVSAPAIATAGSTIKVSWENPVHPGDYITIVAADAPDNEVGGHIRVRDDAAGTLTAPPEPGAYEVRYVLGKGRKLVDRAALELTPANASVSAPAQAIAGSRIKVSWENPVHPADYITIVVADAPADEVKQHIRVRDNLEGSLNAPDKPGAYEVRYVLGKGRKLVSAAPVVIEAE
ncbi:hypothetical protein CWI75_02975 [Kineobactrum sediminis]|uniref:VWFA domain-containing protein n=1 Tax=Kineobactrum sediminis TaxID=1905677 RepID=A0A2N5Y7E8_9GAMM|nr:VWA domain-containing protein [Kineobactrum sediminis]PLW84318.1 hypothetical protein CWI75_02975 [Kineobactrum sediminis]